MEPSLHEIPDHTQIVEESAQTYVRYIRELGLEIATNPGLTKNKFIGSESNPLYPDVIIWKPDYLGSTSGQAILIEQIETESTVSNNVDLWKNLGSIDNIKFYLIVPKGTDNKVAQLIRENSISVDKLQIYEWDPIIRKYKFYPSGVY